MAEIYHKVLGTVGKPAKTNVDTHSKEEVNNIGDSDLQSLIELGCVKDIIKIDSFEFVMRSLSAAERVAMSKEFTGDILTDEQQFDFNIKLLAIAVESVNGKSVEMLHPNFSPGLRSDNMHLKVEIISSLQAPVIARLLEFYIKIMDRCDKQYDVEQVKN